MRLFPLLLLLTFSLLAGTICYAQDEPVLLQPEEEEPFRELLEDEDIEVIKTTRHDPNLAALYSAALPGLGQAYNDMYWKIPIIYGGLAVTTYFVRYNNVQYLEYRRLLFAEIDGDITTENESPLSEEALQRNTDNWRRNRDYMIIVTGFVYLLNIVDAHVDAHFRDFDVSENLSLSIEPSVEQLAIDLTPVAGLSLSLKIK